MKSIFKLILSKFRRRRRVADLTPFQKIIYLSVKRV